MKLKSIKNLSISAATVIFLCSCDNRVSGVSPPNASEENAVLKNIGDKEIRELSPQISFEILHDFSESEPVDFTAVLTHGGVSLSKSFSFSVSCDSSQYSDVGPDLQSAIDDAYTAEQDLFLSSGV